MSRLKCVSILRAKVKEKEVSEKERNYSSDRESDGG